MVFATDLSHIHSPPLLTLAVRKLISSFKEMGKNIQNQLTHTSIRWSRKCSLRLSIRRYFQQHNEIKIWETDLWLIRDILSTFRKVTFSPLQVEDKINSSWTPKYLKGISDLSPISEIQSVAHSRVTIPRDSSALWFLTVIPWVQKPVWITWEMSYWNTERKESRPHITPKALVPSYLTALRWSERVAANTAWRNRNMQYPDTAWAISPAFGCLGRHQAYNLNCSSSS